MTTIAIANTAHLDKLRKAHPQFFKTEGMPWGFDHGDGWDALVESLCRRIASILQEVPNGTLTLRQVKQKFGGLRFYYSLDGVDEVHAQAIRGAVDLAMHESEQTCERCGLPGHIRATRDGRLALCTKCSVQVDKHAE